MLPTQYMSCRLSTRQKPQLVREPRQRTRRSFVRLLTSEEFHHASHVAGAVPADMADNATCLLAWDCWASRGIAETTFCNE